MQYKCRGCLIGFSVIFSSLLFCTTHLSQASRQLAKPRLSLTRKRKIPLAQSCSYKISTSDQVCPTLRVNMAENAEPIPLQELGTHDGTHDGMVKSS